MIEWIKISMLVELGLISITIRKITEKGIERGRKFHQNSCNYFPLYFEAYKTQDNSMEKKNSNGIVWCGWS